VARGEPLPAIDVHTPLGSLPHAFKTELASVPTGIPYLRASEERIAKWRPRLEALPGKRIAFAWAGNAAHINDRNRSIALARLRPLFAASGVTFVSIQREPREHDREVLASEARIVHLGAELEDFSDTAAVISLADLVISVDTSVVHLAGAMGRPLWVLLPSWPDWRWTLTSDASPWYPHARLFRQSADGDWDAVIAGLANDIAATFAA
jgi:ADP-heptose:LPS heptosyltransferase